MIGAIHETHISISKPTVDLEDAPQSSRRSEFYKKSLLICFLACRALYINDSCMLRKLSPYQLTTRGHFLMQP